jgi:hypothetical protein
MVADTLESLSQKLFVERGELLKSLVSTLHYSSNEIPVDIKERLVTLRDKLTGSDFPSLLKRYVGMNLLTDEFDKEGNYVDGAQARIEELARQAVEAPSLLQPELKWLSTKQAEKGYQFGFALAKHDDGFVLLSHLIEAQREAGELGTAFFLGGYLRIVLERSKDLWEETLEMISKDSSLGRIVPELTWRSGELTDSGAQRILRLANEGIAGLGDFSVFGMGGVIRTLNEKSFKEWAEYLLSKSEKAAAFILLDLFDSYYVYKNDKVLPNKTLPVELSYRVLTNAALLDPTPIPHNNMADFHWMQIGLRFIEQHPSYAIPLLTFVLGHFGQDGTIFDGFDSEPENVLDAIARKHPKEAWEVATKFLGPPIDGRAWKVKSWLQRNLNFIPPEVIWAWVDQDVEKHARYVANFAPKALPNKEGGALTRELLIRYGSRSDVRSGLIANHQSGHWWGSSVAHFRQKKESVVQLKSTEDNENVRQWLDDYIDDLDHQIEYFKIAEERDDFHNPSV